MLKELLSKIDADLLKRFGYYFVGMSIGLIVVMFILKQKNVGFPYGPNARVLSQIKLKDTLKISDQAQYVLTQYHLDSLDIQFVLSEGEWDRAKSNVHQKPCPDYWINATIGKEINNEVVRNKFAFIIERCEYIATIKEVRIIEQ